MVLRRSFACSFVTSTVLALGAAAAQPARPDLGTPVRGGSTAAAPAAPAGWPKACVADIQKAAAWFVRELDENEVQIESGPGWRAWRGTTVDSGEVLPVLWLKIEEIDPSSKQSGAVSGWIEVDGAPPGMQVHRLAEDTSVATLPDTHYAKSLGRWRIVRSLVDGTPKEQQIVIKALDKCATALLTQKKKRR